MVKNILLFLVAHPGLLAFVKMTFLIVIVVMPLASLSTWAERRQSAMMQDRLGPNRAKAFGLRLFGIMHFVADAIKMIFKEDLVPKKANRFLFALAPMMAIAPVLITFAIIPFGGTICPHHLFDVISNSHSCQDVISLQVFQSDYGILFYFALASLAVYGSILAGWASYNKWALLGGLRAASQMISYEVTMGMSLMGLFLYYGTLEPGALVVSQGSGILHWGVFTQPLACILFFIAAVAETKRAPFDLPEGEPELIGYFVEYSGMRFGIFFLAEFIETVFVAAMMTTVFFGGWQVPGLMADGFSFWKLPHLAVILLQLVGWSVKILFFCWFQLIIRWTLPRFRPDQLMRLGWKQLLPLSILNFVITALIVLLTQG